MNTRTQRITVKKEAANRVVSDPSFNVLQFFKDMSVHYQNDEVMRSLCSDAMIILSLIEEGCYQALTMKPKYINDIAFEQMHKMGLEVWKKETHGGRWYGIIVDENLTLFYRSTGSKYRDDKNYFEVDTKPSGMKTGGKFRTLVDEKRRKFRRLKMRIIGTTVSQKEKKPWTKPIVWDMRKAFTKFLNSDLGMANISAGHKYTSGSSKYFGMGGSGVRAFSYSFRHSVRSTVRQYGQDKIYHLHFRILANGKKVKVCIDDKQSDFVIPAPEGGFEPRSDSKNEDQVTVTAKFELSDPLLNLKIANFITTITKSGIKFRELEIEPKLSNLLEEAGIK